MEKSFELLNPNGHILIADFFAKDVKGKSPISGGHRLSKYNKAIKRYQLNMLVDQDITKETSYSLDLIDNLLISVVKPIWESLAFYFTSNYPVISSILSRIYKKRLEKMRFKYFSRKTNGKNFEFFKSYRIFLYRVESSKT